MKQTFLMASSFAAILAFLASCGDEIVGIAPPEALEAAQGDTNFIQLTYDEMTILRTMSGQSPKISQDEAISIADKLLGRDNSLSKSAGAVRCEVLTRPSSKISKSGTPEQDTMMYVLNYGNSDGYAVVCADVRVPDQIFAYSDTGEMDTQTDNPGVQMFMDMAQDYMDLKIAEVESKRDSVESVIQSKLEEASDGQGKHLIHCNWGWGDYNGYYLSNMFKCQRDYNIDSSDNRMAVNINSEISDYYYKYYIRIWKVHR